MKQVIAKKIQPLSQKQTVGDIIRQLMKECGNIREAELARQTNLPQATINRLLLGGTDNPRANTLKPIAQFFGVTIGQLLGEEPIDQLRVYGVYQPDKAAVTATPIIKWEDLKVWRELQSTITSNNHDDWVIVDQKLAPGAFALKSLSSMEPIFPKGSILIFEPNKTFIDGSFVLIKIGENIALKRIAISGEIYLEHPFNANIPPSLLDKSYEILGTLTETRMYF